jgi:hypothetical protein
LRDRNIERAMRDPERAGRVYEILVEVGAIKG